VAQIAMSEEYQSRTPLVSIIDLGGDTNYANAILDSVGIDAITEEEPSLLFVKSVHMKKDFCATNTWCSTRYNNVFDEFSVVTTSTATNARKDTLFFHTFSILSKQLEPSTELKPEQ
jgi:hypothetical protein